MNKIRLFLCIFFELFAHSIFADEISRKEISVLSKDLHIPKTWHLSKKMAPVGRMYPDSFCTTFTSKKRNQWLGEICISSNTDFISAMGFRDEVPDEERWGNREEHQIGYWKITPLFTYPMTPFILDPIKIYAAEADCFIEDGPVYRATSTCHAAIYQLREGVFIYSVFHIFDDVKRQHKAYVSDIRKLWMYLGKEISKQSSR
ncbi:hypothetical protein [Herbaspirillum sp. B65]|uniref:hypothetical protein n=1 Tax=Herbaspirillum sp. B65 TaxID=137708 RepID=UPI0020917D6B|nr:hypothetical protein [Herbaspirillum sp. B65]